MNRNLCFFFYNLAFQWKTITSRKWIFSMMFEFSILEKILSILYKLVCVWWHIFFFSYFWLSIFSWMCSHTPKFSLFMQIHTKNLTKSKIVTKWNHIFYSIFSENYMREKYICLCRIMCKVLLFCISILLE